VKKISITAQKTNKIFVHQVMHLSKEQSENVHSWNDAQHAYCNESCLHGGCRIDYLMVIVKVCLIYFSCLIVTN